MLALTNLINQDLGKSSHLFISINIISLNEKDVCIVSVEKSDKPVFCGKNEKEEFYIRASASSQPLGMRESYKYIKSHWGSSS
jgi:predicted HTH transcriptional regulator